MALGDFVYHTAVELVTRGDDDDKKKKDIYPYDPNYPANGFFGVAFTVLFIAHFSLAVKWKKAYAWTLLMGIAWEIIQFVGKIYGGHHQDNENVFIIWFMLGLVAPLWLNAFIYMTASRMVWKWTPDHKVWGLRASMMGKIFVILDIVAFFIQMIGAGAMAKPKNAESGANIFLIGIIVQWLFIAVFTAMLITFHVHSNTLRKRGVIPTNAKIGRVLGGMYAGLLLISVRIAYHVVAIEKSKVKDHTLDSNEIYGLLLDSTVVLLANAVAAVFHPGISLGPGRDIPSRRDRKAEREARKNCHVGKDGILLEGAYKPSPSHLGAGNMYQGVSSRSPSPVPRAAMPPVGFADQHSVAQNGTVYVPRH